MHELTHVGSERDLSHVGFNTCMSLRGGYFGQFVWELAFFVGRRAICSMKIDLVLHCVINDYCFLGS